MQNILLTVKDEGAERLWSYILTYRTMMHREHEASQRGVSRRRHDVILPPTQEQIKIVGNKKRA